MTSCWEGTGRRSSVTSTRSRPWKNTPRAARRAAPTPLPSGRASTSKDAPTPLRAPWKRSGNTLPPAPIWRPGGRNTENPRERRSTPRVTLIAPSRSRLPRVPKRGGAKAGSTSSPPPTPRGRADRIFTTVFPQTPASPSRKRLPAGATGATMRRDTAPRMSRRERGRVSDSKPNSSSRLTQSCSP